MANAPNPESANTASAAPPPSADDETAVPESKIATGTFTLRAPSVSGEVGTLGPYRIVKQLGKGGMGAVYLATDTRLERKIALKLMLPEFAADPDAKDRFLREARAAAKIAHDNVVTVYEADERDGIPYIAMQFLQGAPLDEFLRTKGAPPLAHCVRIGIETARGLAAAHELGLVHRDIKPANLWLEAPNGRVKVLDFGLAKPIGTDAELTKSGAVVGTPAYMSPEQARASKVDHRTDVFSLGVVMYKLLTGRNPFVGANVMAVLMALGTEDPVPIRERNPAVPEALAAFVHRMLAKHPDARPQTALEVAHTLRAAMSQPATESLSAQPVVVLPLPVPEAHQSAFANLLDDHNDAHARTEREAEPLRADAPKRGTGLLIAGGALALVAVIGAAIALGTGGKKPDGGAKNSDPPPAPPVKQGKEKLPPTPPVPKTDGSPLPVSAVGTSPVEVLTFKGHTEAVSTAVFTPDGTRVVTAGWDQLAKVWDSKTGAEALALKGHSDFVVSASYNPDGTRIVTTSADGTAKVWDAKTGAELVTLKGHTGFVLKAVFNADGTRVVTASADQTAKVWDLSAPNPTTGALTATAVLTLRGHARAVNSAAFTPDGTRVLTSSTDETAKLWNAKTGDDLHTIKGHAGSVTSAAFGANGTRVVTSSSDNTAKVWEVSWGKPDGGPVTATELLTLKGHTGFVFGAAFSADSTRIVTASGDKTARVWDAKTGAELCALAGHAGDLRTAAFSRDGARIVTASADHTAKVWELRDSHRAAAAWVLSVGGTVRVEEPGGGVRSITELPKEPFRITNVVLQKGVTADGLALLRRCSPLNSLGLSTSDVTDAALAQLSGMELTHLLVEKTAIGDDGLAVVKSLKEVHDLHFEHTQVTDKGLGHLAGVKLNGLYLDGTAITDASVPALTASEPRHLFLKGTNVTPAGVQKLVAALPNCRITWDGGVIEPKK